MSKVLFIGIMVTEENNNKVYHVIDNENGTTTNSWGRFQGTIEDSLKSIQSKVYPMSEFEKTKNSKIKKGYKDRTAEFTVPDVKDPTKKKLNEAALISSDKGVEQLILALQNFAKVQTAKTYSVTAKSVTKLQIEKAQASIDNLSYSYKNHFKKGWNIKFFNDELLELFSIIPRKMKSVPEHLIKDNWTGKQIEELIEQEQSNLDSMASQVIQEDAEEDQEEAEAKPKEITLLETLGLEVSVVTDKKVIEEVKKNAQQHGSRVKNVYAVINKVTQKAYDKKMATTTTKKTQLLWHGSRVANWWFIIQQGLKIRPSGAVHTGSMFDDGVYFAIEADKSMGYTDSGRWVNSGSNVSSVFMALYEVNLGKQKIVTKHDSSCYKLSSFCKSNGFDSVHAKKGVSLYRDEIIIYNSDQSTIKYLVEFRN